MGSPCRVTWNVTRTCNLNCAYCCGTPDEDELTAESRLRVVDVLADNGLADIGISGGEPFSLEDFLPLLDRMNEYGMNIEINTNGTMLSEAILREIHRMRGISELNISLDWPEDRHDRYRGEGTYRTVIENAGKMRENGIPFNVIWTVTKENYRSIMDITGTCRNLGAKSLTVNDVVPIGKAESRDDLILSSEEIMWLCETAYEIHKGSNSTDFAIWTSYPFSFLVDPEYLVPRMREERADWGVKYNCGVGSERLFISPSGAILPCNLIHTTIGSILEDDLKTLWDSDTVAWYRNLASGPGGKCGVCEYKDICGGCRAATLHRTGRIDGEDPRCPYVPAAYRQSVR